MSELREVLHGSIDSKARELRSGLSTEVLVKSESFTAAVLRLDGGQAIRTHLSKGQSLIQAVTGEGVCLIEGHEYPLAPGDYVYIPKNVSHSIEDRTALTLFVSFSHLIDPTS